MAEEDVKDESADEVADEGAPAEASEPVAEDAEASEPAADEAEAEASDAKDEASDAKAGEEAPAAETAAAETPAADTAAGAEPKASAAEVAAKIEAELAGEVVDEEREDFLPKDLPDPYCRKPWREMVGGLFVVAILVAGVTIYSHNSGGLVGTGTSAIATAGTTAPAFPMTGAVPQGVTPVAFTTPIAAAPAGEPRTAFNAAAHVIRPSVVGIRAVGSGGAGQPGFERVGSGIIVHSAGFVLTCTHVIQGATQLSVGRFRHAAERLPAQVVATEGDLALLRVSTTAPMPAARFANPNALGVGDWVLAIGHPFGMGLSVSAGIVGRRNAELTLPGGVRQQGLVQTDASINEGSSGGPLVNLNGEVVGLNMAIFAPTGVFSGAGFAIDGRRAIDFVQRHLGAPSPQLVANNG